MKYIIQLLSLVTVLLFALGLPASAEEAGDRAVMESLPDYYPDSFDRKGRLQEVRLEEGVLVVSAVSRRYDPNAQVHSLVTEHSSLHHLKPGMVLGLRFDSAKDKVISEIWVLPDSVQWQH